MSKVEAISGKAIYAFVVQVESFNVEKGPTEWTSI
jgi:hypothetical protein